MKTFSLKLLAISVVLLSAPCSGADKDSAQAVVSMGLQEKLSAVLLAITDEIYYYNMEEESPTVNMSTETPVYIELDDKAGSCRAIYRLYPDGEVFRRFFFTPDGLAILAGDARKGFLWWQHRNPYVGQTTEIPDDELIRYKQMWRKLGYRLSTGFDKTELIMRQAKRFEFLRRAKSDPAILSNIKGCPP